MIEFKKKFQMKRNWIVKTNNNKVFSAPNIIIAGGVGSFEPRKISLKSQKNMKEKSIFFIL